MSTEANVDWDVAVVGAGPAGTCAARILAEAGLRTALLERRAQIGIPVRCGELIRTESLARAADPNGPWTIRRFSAYALCGPLGGRTVFEGGDFGRMIDRRIFDAHLADRARKAGARLLLGTDVIALRRSGPLFNLQTSGNGHATITVRAVVAADGVASRVARWLGLRTAGSMRGIASAAFGTLIGSRLDKILPSLRFGADIAPGGYAWFFPLDRDRANVGVGLNACRARESALDALHRYAAMQGAHGRLEDIRAGALPISPPLPVAHVDGALVVGDAARHVNPLTGAGIGAAVCSGLLAGRVLADALARGDTGAAALARFDALWRAENRDFHMRAVAVRRYLSKLSDEAVDELVRRLPSRLPHHSVAEDLGLMAAGAA